MSALGSILAVIGFILCLAAAAFGATLFIGGIQLFVLGVTLICLGEIRDQARRTADQVAILTKTLQVEAEQIRAYLSNQAAAAVTARDLAEKTEAWNARKDALLLSIEQNTRRSPESIARP